MQTNSQGTISRQLSFWLLSSPPFKSKRRKRLVRFVVLMMEAGMLGFSGHFALVAQIPPQHYRFQTRAVIESHLKAFSTANGQREKLIREWLIESGCETSNLRQQPLERQLPPNVICALPGETSETIIVGAHTDHVEEGDGVVDNWTGAVLLPALLYSLEDRPRHHTIVFVGFSAEEKGLVGSQFYVAHLRREERARVEAMVNFDSLGLGSTKVWAARADKSLLKALTRTAQASGLPLAVMNPESGASADSESFSRFKIPAITVHSVTEETWPVLHSPRDRLAIIKMDNYYESYKLLAAYLTYLDETLKPGQQAPGRTK